ncbi:MAG TPA: carboxypeptidase-like regulatory domain-containing protein [Streptosporangiaceae bacterium]|nr:carboxypeptidase-like regulatory domain-containing protein [Streptosporangiaceae bacterium]
MKPTDASSREPMDDRDFAVLDHIRDIYRQIDPMPADLPERIRFSLGMRGLEAEVARLAAEDDLLQVAARGAEHSRTVTFDSDSLTVMIRIDPSENDTVRIDGWLAPAQRREIDMQTTAGTLHALSDEQGRFAFTSVPHGTARLLVRAAGHAQGDIGRPVVTPALIL